MAAIQRGWHNEPRGTPVACAREGEGHAGHRGARVPGGRAAHHGRDPIGVPDGERGHGGRDGGKTGRRRLLAPRRAECRLFQCVVLRVASGRTKRAAARDSRSDEVGREHRDAEGAPRGDERPRRIP